MRSCSVTPSVSDPRVALLRSGLIDEVVLECRHVEVRRTGDARYRFTLQGGQDELVEFDLWTSRVGVIEFLPRESRQWVAHSKDTENITTSLTATDCLFHLEQMDRGVYWLGLSRAQEHVSIDIRTNGYLKTSLVSTTVATS